MRHADPGLWERTWANVAAVDTPSATWAPSMPSLPTMATSSAGVSAGEDHRESVLPVGK